MRGNSAIVYVKKQLSTKIPEIVCVKTQPSYREKRQYIERKKRLVHQDISTVTQKMMLSNFHSAQEQIQSFKYSTTR